MWQIILDILVALLASLGLMFVIGTLCDWFMATDAVTVAIWIRTVEDMEGLDILLQDARMGLRHRRAVPVVLIDSNVLPHITVEDGRLLPAYEAIITGHRAVWYSVSSK